VMLVWYLHVSVTYVTSLRLPLVSGVSLVPAGFLTYGQWCLVRYLHCLWFTNFILIYSFNTKRGIL